MAGEKRCRYCDGECIRAGKRKGIQRKQCKKCGKYQQQEYKYNAYAPESNQTIKNMVREGCGIRSISRLLQISRNTVMVRIVKIANGVERPLVRIGKTYEMDELKTYLKRKSNEQWIVYAIDRQSREVADFRVGRRSKKTLGKVIENWFYLVLNRFIPTAMIFTNT